ncbi:arylacetamide deacetylase isoform X1 [Octopus bimaculoides]|uniref:arylacetamide deacetylase isoform X1 n=1 Tax=Octopus bimaculoides TaxID=37653 RepID=UPI00071C24B9|nr:arylacetamide deacetylase isoform X1 [Octopus bimaculoides]XP_014769955.1 arylacetamide deacetylase isoform X1 [Octopus bimaculoides]XP_014770034.1 arylacetamide deacetylase isoform X1 [Octopus bimaculoides]XP_014770105.1 arylacetamide deacetylase isoform X1 [Octopus bimaculoides]XP_052826988.1 arylacetamide deacetylase isoform X1 [Octopus bimaculoides]|eukprot:XP_014769880.1 PREDICTED: arylacetamide deacetylase-like isoform X1 [Octopus bimaculoides]
MILKNLGVILAVITVLISYWLYEPLPDSVAEPWKLRTVIAGSKVLHAVCSGFEMTGYTSYLNCTRQFSNAYIRNIQSNDKISVVDENFSGVKVRIYYPAGVSEKDKTKLLPGILYFHPGGWTFGRMGVSHSLLERLTQETGAAFIDVDYRLAPEHIFPVPFDDCLTATVHILRNGRVYGIDSSRIAVSGDEAGGNLAAAVSLRLAVETAFPTLRAQILISPPLQAFDFLTPSMLFHDKSVPFIMSRRMITQNWLNYYQGRTKNIDEFLINNHTAPLLKESEVSQFVSVRQLPERYQKQHTLQTSTDFGDENISYDFEPVLLNPYFCPLLAQDFKKIPQAYIISVEFDVLRDDSFLFVERLRQSGVKVYHDHFNEAFHGILMCEHFEMRDKIIASLVSFIKGSI